MQCEKLEAHFPTAVAAQAKRMGSRTLKVFATNETAIKKRASSFGDTITVQLDASSVKAIHSLELKGYTVESTETSSSGETDRGVGCIVLRVEGLSGNALAVPISDHRVDPPVSYPAITDAFAVLFEGMPGDTRFVQVNGLDIRHHQHDERGLARVEMGEQSKTNRTITFCLTDLMGKPVKSARVQLWLDAATTHV